MSVLAQFSRRLVNNAALSPRSLVPGLFLVACVTATSALISAVVGLPALLIALAIGLLIRAPDRNAVQVRGLEFAAGPVLKFGVVLLGAQVSFSQILDLGWPALVLAVGVVGLTLLIGLGLGRAFGLTTAQAIIGAGAVAICGASATIAIASVLPKQAIDDRTVVVTIVGVTALSSIAMVLYPAIAHGLDLSDFGAGLFFGSSIHDVAQVVGAGALTSEEAVETALVVKLIRVTCLVPAMVLISVAVGSGLGTGTRASMVAAAPLFLIAFIALVIVSSSGILPASAEALAAGASHWCLVVAVAALGVKTSFRNLIASNHRSAWSMTIASALLAGGVLCAIAMIPALSIDGAARVTGGTP